MAGLYIKLKNKNKNKSNGTNLTGIPESRRLWINHMNV